MTFDGSTNAPVNNGFSRSITFFSLNAKKKSNQKISHGANYQNKQNSMDAIITYGFLMWYRICVFGLMSLKWSLFSISVVSRPVCVGEIVILVRYATAILNCPTLVLKSPIICSLYPSPESNTINKFIWRFNEPFSKYMLTCGKRMGKQLAALITYRDYQFVDFRNKFDRRCQNIPYSSFATICMQALSVLLAPTTWAVCPYDCKLNMIRAMFCPIIVYCMTVTRLPIS